MSGNEIHITLQLNGVRNGICLALLAIAHFYCLAECCYPPRSRILLKLGVSSANTGHCTCEGTIKEGSVHLVHMFINDFIEHLSFHQIQHWLPCIIILLLYLRRQPPMLQQTERPYWCSGCRISIQV